MVRSITVKISREVQLWEISGISWLVLRLIMMEAAVVFRCVKRWEFPKNVYIKLVFLLIFKVWEKVPNCGASVWSDPPYLGFWGQLHEYLPRGGHSHSGRQSVGTSVISDLHLQQRGDRRQDLWVMRRSEMFCGDFRSTVWILPAGRLDFPPVKLVRIGLDATLSFGNPFHFYGELRKAAKPDTAIFRATITLNDNVRTNQIRCRFMNSS